MFRHTFFFKLFIGFLLIILVFTGSILLLSFQTIKKHYIETLSLQLKNICTSLSLKITPMLENGNEETLDSLVKDWGKNIEARITVVKPNGEVIADSEEAPSLMDNHRHRPEIRDALQGEPGKALRYSRTVEEDMLYVAVAAEKSGEILGVIRVSLFLKDINALIGALKLKIAGIALSVILASLLLAFLIARSFTKPIKMLQSASQKISEGDFGVKILLKNRDELKELADTFNHMTMQITKLFKELSREREELTLIISSIQEGLVVIDKESRIILANESFKEMIQDKEVEGKYYWQALRSPEIAELVRKVREQKSGVVKEISCYGRIYLCSFDYNPQGEETIIMFFDITDMRKFEEITKEFTVNVSHEFKTPLAAIKGFVETIEEEEDIKNREYLEIIKRNTNRLINITNDLLLLSKIESKEEALNFKSVDAIKLIENIIKIFQPRLKEKDLYLKIEADRTIPKVFGDSFLLEQAFINLIDNAINYTEKGGLIIRLSKDNKKVKIEFEDTGIGIPEEHISRIFSRFYVVNKSRSRQMGGTGLGLSIVKHIILQHNGKIEVKSKPGEGTILTIILPIKKPIAE